MNNMKKYYPTAFCLYLNYFVHGIGASILAQNSKSLQAMWHTDAAAVLYVISALGIGRLIALPFSGAISDKFGRRPTVLLGMLIYAAFFGLILITPNASVGFAVALLAGIANSFLDLGCIPAAMEILVESTGLASILTKLFISIGQYALPVAIGLLLSNNLYFGYSFIICIVILVINGIILLKLPFAPMRAKKAENSEEAAEEVVKPKFLVEGIALIIMGFTSTATFQIFLNVNKNFGIDAVGMTASAAGKIQANYALGSICAVILTALLVKKLVKPVRFLFIYPLISFVMLMAMFITKSQTIALIGGFVIGFSAAGGVLQLVVSTMSDLFPVSKGKITSMVMMSSSIATFAVTAIAGFVTKSVGIQYTLVVAAAITAVGVLLSIVVNVRYNQLVKAKKQLT
ncbi:Inner membrane transport protein YdiM [Clostridium felsineum DSM 794]|nr:Inner membrane transport protein YdiM [Clostridium felsineum DSM 794]